MDEDQEVIPLTDDGAVSLTLRFTPSLTGVVIGGGEDRTGLLVWRGARDMLGWLRLLSSGCSHNEATRLPRTVIELGGGIGIGALAVAALWPRVHAITTDYFEPALQLARHHTEINAAAFSRTQSTVSVLALDWRDSLSSVKKSHTAGSCDSPSAVSSYYSSCDLVIGLDVIYPDTRTDILLGLMSTARSILSESKWRANTQRPNFLQDTFLTTFVDRDVCKTLRRLIVAASLVGLQVDPYAVAFIERDLFHSFWKGRCCSNLPRSDASRRGWDALRLFLLGTRCDKIGRAMCSGGTWLLSVTLPSARQNSVGRSPEAAAEFLASATPQDMVLTVRASGVNSQWLEEVPWLWQADNCFQACVGPPNPEDEAALADGLLSVGEN